METQALTDYLQYFRQRLAVWRNLYNVARHRPAPDEEYCAALYRQLKRFVPMYRSLSAAGQQLENGTKKGDALYRKQFRQLTSALALAGAQVVPPGGYRVVHAELLALELLVPVEGQSVAGWARQTVAALIDEAIQDLNEANRLLAVQRHSARQAKDAFLGGLSIAQLAQLRALVASTKAAGLGPLTFVAMDVA